jgi:hypothetical protein
MDRAGCAFLFHTRNDCVLRSYSKNQVNQNQNNMEKFKHVCSQDSTILAAQWHYGKECGDGFPGLEEVVKDGPEGTYAIVRGREGFFRIEEDQWLVLTEGGNLFAMHDKDFKKQFRRATTHYLAVSFTLKGQDFDAIKEALKFLSNYNPGSVLIHAFMQRSVVLAKGFPTTVVDALDELFPAQVHFFNDTTGVPERNLMVQVVADLGAKVYVIGDVTEGVKEEAELYESHGVKPVFMKGGNPAENTVPIY